ncbi:hypothetical protein [Marinomonas sp. BSi20584]|uniref:hypothetical protein n=1 Tax=Marinomonas sp. BSi20584 TaxID=1594462 RepID=UPI000C1E92C9|nr:hypothetical protein [Marinomonas sp. BSi20584]PJE57156.1 hypothetical protein TY87_00325 [Marinomonas sp. BSi20584]
MRSIEVSFDTYNRLEALAEGFDTPEAVIIRLLDSAEGRVEAKPLLSFSPMDEDFFKQKLIETKEAEVVIYKTDGSREVTRWKANRISSTSNLRGNLWSGLLRGWKSKGIKSAEFNILPQWSGLPEDDTEQIKALALSLNLTFEELSLLDYTIDENISDEGILYNQIIQFSESCDKEILKLIDGLHENLWINI